VIGLKNTGLDDGIQVIRDYSSGYLINKEIVNSPYIDMTIPQGAYGIYSTVEDLFLFDNALHSRTILSNKSIEMMEGTYFRCYGYGWFIYSSEELVKQSKCVGHYGDINGYSNQVLRFPEKEIFISVLSYINITPADTIAKNIARIFNGEKINIPERTIKSVDFSEHADIVGDYKLSNTEQIISVKHEDGRWYAIIPKRYGVRYYIEMKPISNIDNQLIFATDYIHEELTFRKGNSNNIELEYKDFNNSVFIGSLIDNIS
jgi:hypothetical protein